jgi:hypothetical protein
LQKRTACAEEVNELFWTICTAIGPEAAANAAAHNHAITMRFVVTNVGHGDVRLILVLRDKVIKINADDKEREAVFFDKSGKMCEISINFVLEQNEIKIPI